MWILSFCFSYTDNKYVKRSKSLNVKFYRRIIQCCFIATAVVVILGEASVVPGDS